MHYFFSLHPALLFVFFLVFGVFLYAVGAVCLRRFMRKAQDDEAHLPLPVMLSAMATTWSLAFGFTASDIWSLNNHASQVASAERSSLSRLLGITHADALNDEHLNHQLKTYRNLVVGVEWGRDLNRVPNSEVEQILQALRVGLLENSLLGATPNEIMAQMVNDFDELQDARNERLAIGSSHINYYKWYFLLALSVLVQIAMSAIHADRLQGGRKAALMYAVMVSASLYILVLHSNPYAGAAKIQAETLYAMPF